ncbi:hypothetical protein CIRG_01707 [Coccidioides immitis RMSCC 2394]|uniref:Centrosomin N-terminal motif 1 domain-containing protein n=1 Tax=Coccidioides immitis RMSCC 2394 TaxID=404692 RepID=A0A0J6Y4K1_COCIT|nr:hypothetical protein CIRG_01707 [Coccidioides immitis RMSCC 2394]
MDSIKQGRQSTINTGSPPAHFNPSRMSSSRRKQLSGSITPERTIHRQPRRSSLHVSKASVNGVHADYRDMSNSHSSPGGYRPITPRRACSTPLGVNPNSALLKDMINERRAARGTRPSGSSEHGSNDRSPSVTADPSGNLATSEKSYNIHNPISAGLKEPTDMGLREMNKYISKINKEIFDLKLEIVHRIEHINTLKKKLERIPELEEQIEKLEASRVELQEENQNLQNELDRRDRGLYEAVGLICDLENKIEDMAAERAEAPSTPHPYRIIEPVPSTEALDEGQTPKNAPMIDVPDRTSSRRGTTSATSRRSRVLSLRQTRRQPSFLQDQTESTSALRSLYFEDVNSSRRFSIFSGHESEALDSPRLSALSECSDLNPPPSPIKLGQPQIANMTPSQNSTPSPDTGTVRHHEAIGSKFSRIEQWIPAHSPLQVTHDQTPTKPETPSFHGSSRKQPALGAAFEAKRNPSGSKPPPTRDSATFGGRLPPTPDTMSTSFIDPRNRSNPNIIEERSMYGTARIFSSVTSVASVGRPGSAGDITTRPSTADTALLNGAESWNYPDFAADRNARLNSLFPPPTYTRHLSEPPPGMYIDESHYDTKKGDSLPSVTPPKYAASIKSTMSDSAISQFSRNKTVTNSHILSPEDWLEAALPISNDDIARADKQADVEPEVYKSAEAYESGDQTNAGPPTTPVSRIRHKRLASMNPNDMRRRFTFRIFGRSKTNSPFSADPDAEETEPYRGSQNKRPGTARRRSIKFDPLPTTRDRPLSLHSATGAELAKRPRTSNSMENVKNFRRAQHSVFSWFKGPKNSNGSEASGRLNSQPPGRPNSACEIRNRSSVQLTPKPGTSNHASTMKSRSRHPLSGQLT